MVVLRTASLPASLVGSTPAIPVIPNPLTAHTIIHEFFAILAFTGFSVSRSQGIKNSVVLTSSAESRYIDTVCQSAKRISPIMTHILSYYVIIVYAVTIIQLYFHFSKRKQIKSARIMISAKEMLRFQKDHCVLSPGWCVIDPTLPHPDQRKRSQYTRRTIQSLHFTDIP